MSNSDPVAAATPDHGPGASAPPNADAPRGTVRVVKRYNNRKLYDTVESRYVTLPQIAELVRKGEDVRIIDNNTKEDLTSMTLAQILYEEERKQSRPLPLTALKELLHASGERFISTLREGPVGKLIGRADAAPEAPEPEKPSEEPTVDATVSVPTVEAATRVQQLVEQSRGALDQWQHRMDDRMKAFWESINPAGQIQALQAEVRRLQNRIEELETHIVRRGSAKGGAEGEASSDPSGGTDGKG